MEKSSRTFLSVLLADDDPDDCMIFGDAVAEIDLNVDLQTVKDGEELMNYLVSSAIILPEILFLDLNMPFKNGFQCLHEIRENKTFRDIFIIIYTTSSNPKDIDEAFERGANLYIQKPNSFTELKNILSQIFTLDLKESFAPSQKERFVFNGMTSPKLG